MARKIRIIYSTILLGILLISTGVIYWFPTGDWVAGPLTLIYILYPSIFLEIIALLIIVKSKTWIIPLIIQAIITTFAVYWTIAYIVVRL